MFYFQFTCGPQDTFVFEIFNLEKVLLHGFLAWRGRVYLSLIGHHFFKTNLSSTRSISGLTALEKGREFSKGFCSDLTQSPSTWEVDASIECLLLRDELWTNAQNSIDINSLRESASRAQQCCSHVIQQWRGYSELQQKIRAKPQPTPRTAVLLTARLAILPLQSLSQTQHFLECLL